MLVQVATLRQVRAMDEDAVPQTSRMIHKDRKAPLLYSKGDGPSLYLAGLDGQDPAANPAVGRHATTDLFDQIGFGLVARDDALLPTFGEDQVPGIPDLSQDEPLGNGLPRKGIVPQIA